MTTQSVSRSPNRFLLTFFLLVVSGFFIQVLPWVDENWVTPYLVGLASVSGHIIEFFGGSVTVVGDTMWAVMPTLGVRIDNGCSGIEAAILVVSAVLAFPAGWKVKLIGLVAGVSAILGVNVVRVISLYYLIQYSQEWFDWAHLYLWDLLIILDGLLAFFLWARWARQQPLA
jgi:exosortase H (IPTLxxWG-CTERM-specific)